MLIESFKNNRIPDILETIANLSSDEVFTPPDVVRNMLDLLPKEVWSNPDLKFLDPACKTGIFLRESANRLMKGLEEVIPDEEKRREHIFKKMLYGIAITEITSMVSRRSVYYSKDAAHEKSVVQFSNSDGNILYENIEHTTENHKCIHCGEAGQLLSRIEGSEHHAYQFIHDSNLFRNMKFDVIIGNPPYQLETKGPGRQAKPIYQHFVSMAKKMNPKYLVMITPSRWFAGGMGLDGFRRDMLNDSQIRVLVDYVDARECFPGVDIAGGISYFLWKKDSSGDCHIVSRFQDKEYASDRPLNEFETFIRFAPAVSIVKKVKSKKEDNLTSIISATRPFGLKTSDRPDAEGDLRLVSSGGEGPLHAERVTAGKNMVRKWKLMTSKASHDHGGQPDKDGYRRVLSRVEILKPNQVCTESYIILGVFDTKKQTENYMSFIKTKFTRFLISLLSFSQDITRDRFNFVPLLDMSKTWTDKELYKYFELTSDEIAFIESKIKPMD